MIPYVNNSYRQHIATKLLQDVIDIKQFVYIVYSKDSSRSVAVIDQTQVENADISSVKGDTTTPLYAIQISDGLKIATEIKGDANPAWVGVSELTLPGDTKLWVSREPQLTMGDDNKDGKFWKTLVYTEEVTVEQPDTLYNVVSLIVSNENVDSPITDFTTDFIERSTLMMQSRPKDTVLPQGTTLLNTVLTF